MEVEPPRKRILLDHDYTNRFIEVPVHSENNNEDSAVTKYENEKLVKMIEYKITFKKFYHILHHKFGYDIPSPKFMIQQLLV